MRTALAVLGLVAFLALPAFAGTPAPTPMPAPKAPAADASGPGALFVESDPDGANKLVLSGSIRTVWDYHRNFTDFNSNSDRVWSEYVDSRVEMGFLFKLNDGVDVFLQPQVNYVWGGRRLTVGADSAGPPPDTFAVEDGVNNDNLRIYQAYVALHPEFGRVTTTLKIGRQELSFGSEMLLGNDTRYNGLSFDAVRLDVSGLAEGLTTTLFGAKVVENDRLYVNGISTGMDLAGYKPADAYLFGLWNTLVLEKYDTTIDLYGLLFRTENGIAAGAVSDYNGVPLPEEDVWTLGSRVNARPIELTRDHSVDLDFSIEGAAQFGSTDVGGVHSRITDAYALETELGVSFNGERKKKAWVPRVALGLALATGDKNPGDDRIHTFQPLFEDTCQRLGDADLFSLSNLKCWYVNGSVNPLLNLEVGATYYRFEAAHVEDTIGGGNFTQPGNGFAGIAGSDNDVADEFDFYADWKISKNVSLRTVLAWVDPADQIREQPGTANSPATRLFTCLVVKW
jgi:hypothetical protein